MCGHHPYPEFQPDVLAVPAEPKGTKRLGLIGKLRRIVEICWLEDRNIQPNVGDVLFCPNDAAAFWYMRAF